MRWLVAPLVCAMPKGRKGSGGGAGNADDPFAAFADMLGGGAGGGATDPGDRFCKKKGQVMAPKMSMFDEGMLKANGCGPMGMQVTEEYGLYQCCNQHDLCYSICNPGFVVREAIQEVYGPSLQKSRGLVRVQ